MMHSFARKAWLPAVVATPALVMASGVQAAQLHVRPVTIDLTAPAAAATLTLTNRSKSPITMQVRIFEWRQQNGRDVLKRTRAVVASPPQMRMRPGRAHVVRVVRLSKRPVVGEEAYRVIVDQIPRKKSGGSGVVFALRYSIPVFISAANATPPALSWRVARQGRQLLIEASNSGQRRDRIAGLRLRLPNGATRVVSQGLAGYVLGNSRRVWRVNATARKGARVIIEGQGINGPFRITTRVR